MHREVGDFRVQQFSEQLSIRMSSYHYARDLACGGLRPTP